MKPASFLKQVNKLVSGAFIAYSLLFSQSALCMNPKSPQSARSKHARVLQVLRETEEDKVEKLLNLIEADAKESIAVDGPDGESTYVERALVRRNKESTQDAKAQWDKLIKKLIAYGFPISKAVDTVRAQLMEILTDQVTLATLGEKKELEAILVQAKHTGKSVDIKTFKRMVRFAAAQRKSEVVELLIRHGANSGNATEVRKAGTNHVNKLLAHAQIFSESTQQEYSELLRVLRMPTFGEFVQHTP